MPEFLEPISGYIGKDLWIAQVFIVVLLVLVANLIQKRVLARIYARVLATDNVWDDAVIDALRKPLTLLFWVVGLSLAAEVAKQQSDSAIFNAIGPIRDVGVIACVTWFLIRLVQRIERNIIDKRSAEDMGVDQSTVDAIGKLVRLSFIITATLVMLQTLGYSISGVLAFGGIGGVVIGFAAKDLLANFFGGLMIYLDRPFAVGDWIRSPDRDIEGTVEKIGWRLTIIRTFDKRPLYIPNSMFNSISVENPSRMSNRRIYETIGIRYDDAGKMADIVHDVKDMLKNHQEIDSNQTLIVNFNSFAPFSLDFFVYTFTKTTSWVQFHEIKQDVLLKINDIIIKRGAEVAFPTSTIHLANEFAGKIDSLTESKAIKDPVN